MERIFEQNYKRLGMLEIDGQEDIDTQHFKPYIRVLYLPAGYSVTVDFQRFDTRKPALFFINSNQYFQLEKAGSAKGYLIYYNRDFYCVQIHDEEVACDGLLFNNIYGMPMTALPAKEDKLVAGAMHNILEELGRKESQHEEMIRTYLKQMIILATRVWKQQQLGQLKENPSEDIEFFRHFSRLVEIHFREKHSVNDYAELLGVAAKTLSKKFNRLRLSQPNDVIKDRILLEAKRLLAYSPLSIKEVAYDLGYDDPAYFNRLFTAKAGCTPAVFRKSYVAADAID